MMGTTSPRSGARFMMQTPAGWVVQCRRCSGKSARRMFNGPRECHDWWREHTQAVHPDKWREHLERVTQ